MHITAYFVFILVLLTSVVQCPGGGGGRGGGGGFSKVTGQGADHAGNFTIVGSFSLQNLRLALSQKNISRSVFQLIQLQFGREPRLPTDEPSSSFTFNKSNDYYVQLKKNLLIIQQPARDNIIHRQRQYKINYDKQRPDPHYEINDPVLIKIHGIKKKLEPTYSITPKIIIRKQHPIDWVKDEKPQVESRVHVNDI
ncbi:unnamed protein product [Rotaria sordida]|uniref:Uncharacterized protein n=1 Tax=Rotaria sordida TaxID=392033 RepID=A0A814YK31_9BILA|nr:unnamed protein product [Rotaria sordida]CAF1512164.1 unnamed protein product [Rotaria sordida]